jgi:YihY family inner membrane protein
MSSVDPVPETWELSGDDARATLASTGRRRLAGDAFRRFRAADGTSHARSMAFLSGLIFIQGIVTVLGLASALGEGTLSRLIVDTLQSAAPGPAGKLLTQAVTQAHRVGASHRYAALVVGLATVLISGTMLMGQFERGLNRIYGIERDRPTVSKYGRAFLLAVSTGLMIAAAFLALGIGRSIADSLGSRATVRIWDVVRWPVGITLMMATIALLYRWSPRRRQPAWSWLAFGALVAVSLWTLSTVALSVFFGFSSSFGQTYGPLAGIIALALWSLAASAAMLYGAAVAAQLEAVRGGTPASRDGIVSNRAPVGTPAAV